MTTNMHTSRRYMLGLAAAAGTALIATGAGAQITFAPTATVGALTQPGGAAAADFDGDGDVDLAVTLDNPDRLIVLLNGGAGTFTPGRVTFLPSGSGADRLVAGNLDADTDVDLVVILKNNSTIMPLFNNGAGLFTLGAQVATGLEPVGIDMGDFNGDGRPDLIVANRDGNSVTILRGLAGGGFAPATVAVGLEPRDASFGDFDGDGDLDAVATNHDDRTISILTNTGGIFSVSATILVSANVRPEGVDTGDVDGDGDMDIVTAGNGGGLEVISVFRNTGGSFGPPSHFATGGIDTSDVVLADMDCDGDLDAATANNTSNNVSVLANNGTGAFGAPLLRTAGVNPEVVIAADLDGDGAGDSDLATADRDSSSVSVMINMTCTKTPPVFGDLNGDGVVSGLDLGIMLGQWTGAATYAPCPPHQPADLNQDCRVNGLDIALLLGAWG